MSLLIRRTCACVMGPVFIGYLSILENAVIDRVDFAAKAVGKALGRHDQVDAHRQFIELNFRYGS
jgi:hypothetical protein